MSVIHAKNKSITFPGTHQLQRASHGASWEPQNEGKECQLSRNTAALLRFLEVGARNWVVYNIWSHAHWFACVRAASVEEHVHEKTLKASSLDLCLPFLDNFCPLEFMNSSSASPSYSCLRQANCHTRLSIVGLCTKDPQASLAF